MLFLSSAASAQIGVSVSIAPPELPVYDQPICPGDGYIWTPGYWAWDGEYYWVPGTWVLAPEVGYLWTPGYWGWGGSGFLFYDGYWGPTVGFYGGINYGFGYYGHGYEGGRWQDGHFFYNTSINRVDEHSIHNVYNSRVNESSSNHVSYNGGNGGTNERPNSLEEAAAHEKHIAPVASQKQHAYVAHNNPQQRVSANHGKPAVTATPRPNLASHPKELPPVEKFAAPNTGNAKLDQQYQKQQQSVATKQNQERQSLQQKQDHQHQQLTKQNAPPQRMQQVEQQHQQQTQQLQQRHTQQTQQMQQKQEASGGSGSRGGGSGGGRR
ncbi:MAG TPA: YXWGXW repeat-containing protein [Candidatus Saccharimonadales bacterium]|nr:YXWGXW repeat-containing protein [Candidatus Saccharimonadales bacterium]